LEQFTIHYSPFTYAYFGQKIYVPNIAYHLTDGIITITINRPDKLNALNDTVITELGGAWTKYMGMLK